jgi:hypothetical protein
MAMGMVEQQHSGVTMPMVEPSRRERTTFR